MVAIRDKHVAFHAHIDLNTRYTPNHNNYYYLLFDDVTVYLNLIGVQDSLHVESAQPRNC